VLTGKAQPQSFLLLLLSLTSILLEEERSLAFSSPIVILAVVVLVRVLVPVGDLLVAAVSLPQ